MVPRQFRAVGRLDLDKCAFVATRPGVRWEGPPPWPIMSGPITYGGRFVAPEGGD